MSILFEAWRRARGSDSRLAETLGAPPAAPLRRPAILPWVLCFLFAAVAAGLGVYLWRVSSGSGGRVSARTPSSVAPAHPLAAADTRALRDVNASAPAKPEAHGDTNSGASGDAGAGSPASPTADANAADLHAAARVVQARPATTVARSAGAGAAAREPQPGASGVTERSSAGTATTVAAAGTGAGAVPDGVREALPSFNVTVHVWNEDPSRRFIVVDGKFLHTGDEIVPGVRLASITRDGEIVEFRGYRIELGGS